MKMNMKENLAVASRAKRSSIPTIYIYILYNIFSCIKWNKSHYKPTINSALFYFLLLLIFLVFFFGANISSSEEEVGGGVGISSGIFFLCLLDFLTAGLISCWKEDENSGRSINGSNWSIRVSFGSHNPSLVRFSVRVSVSLILPSWLFFLFLFNLRHVYKAFAIKRVLKAWSWHKTKLKP